MEPQDHADLSRVLLDAVGLMNELGIRYALVGGLAAMVYGRARYTEDVDLITLGDHESVMRDHPDAMKTWRFDPTCTYKLYHDSGVSVDLWKDAYVDDMVRRARITTLADQPVAVVEPIDLLAMKLRARRPQDDYDVSEILKRMTIDETVLRERVDGEAFAHFLTIKKRTHP